MKLLLNDKEIIHFLVEVFCNDQKFYQFSKMEFLRTDVAINDFVERTQSVKYKPEKDIPKNKKKIHKAIVEDYDEYFNNAKAMIIARKKHYYKLFFENIDRVLTTIGEDVVFDLYQKHKKINFVKSVGFNLNSNSTFVRRKTFVDDNTEDCLIRNTVGNEDLLVTKIDNNYPFWFIDSGYTNFLEPNKKWHRLVRSHLHYGDFFNAPVDRLSNFKIFPKPWRENGEKILVIEPGAFAAKIFHVDMTTWRYNVEAELRKYTDKPIVFREKAPKKQRPKLFHELLNEDYYCVVNINSNAATESIWAGIPVITLDKHITNYVSRNNLSDINNLYRPNLANWLSVLSYSQFTYDELVNGTAGKIVNKYHV